MSLGLNCQYMVKVVKKSGAVEWVNMLKEKHLQFGQFQAGNYSQADISKVWLNNTTELLVVLKHIQQAGYSLMRISSGLLPLYDQVEAELKLDVPVLDKLAEIGSFVREHGFRLTSHPDQYNFLNSDRDSVIDKTIVNLEHHAWVFDQMGLDKTPFYAINIHGGKKGNSQKAVDTINNRLSESVKSRLTLENDESAFSVKELYKIYELTGIPIVFDSHHHVFNEDGLTIEEACKLAGSTWNGVKQLTHLSNTTPGMESGNFTERRKHSDYVHYIPACQLEGNNQGLLDIEMEFKMKNLAIEKAVLDFGLVL